jgi:hypothetical protein
MMRARAGISELYASLMLLIIISTMGSIVYSYTMETTLSYQENFIENEARETERILERFTIVSVFWNTQNDDLNITVLNFGEFDTTVVKIYVNDVIVSGYYTGLNENIGPLQLKEISFQSPISIIEGEQYTIIIVSKKGVVNSHIWKK